MTLLRDNEIYDDSKKKKHISWCRRNVAHRVCVFCAILYQGVLSLAMIALRPSISAGRRRRPARAVAEIMYAFDGICNVARREAAALLHASSAARKCIAGYACIFSLRIKLG